MYSAVTAHGRPLVQTIVTRATLVLYRVSASLELKRFTYERQIALAA